MSSSEDESPTINDENVFNKYSMAADIINCVLKELVALAQPGKSTLELCCTGDKRIEEEVAKIFKKEKSMKKGIAFPTCVSVNNIVGYYCPLKSEPNVIELKEGDLVKINLGAHVDGFPVMVGHSFVCLSSPGTIIKDRKADVIMAAHTIGEACMRLIKPGNENYTVTDFVNRFAKEFQCKPVEGIQCHQTGCNKYALDKAIVWNPNEEQKRLVEKCEFAVHEVWNVNVVVSTGDGKPRLHNSRTTVFKKNDNVYNLKMKASRQFFKEVITRFQSFPFSLRSFEDENKARMGVRECVQHDLLEQLDVHQEKDGEYVAQFQYTLLLMPSGPIKLTGIPFDKGQYESNFQVTDQSLKDVLTITIAKKSAKKKKKKKSESRSEPTEEMSQLVVS